MTVDQALIDRVLSGEDVGRPLAQSELVAIARTASARGWTPTTIATFLGVRERTVRAWTDGNEAHHGGRNEPS